MSWHILINTTGSHFKFWSHNTDDGQRHWGRIGSAGQYSDNFSVSQNMDKEEDKIRGGYVTFAMDADYSQPSAAQVRQFLSGSTANQRPRAPPVSARQSVGRTRRPTAAQVRERNESNNRLASTGRTSTRTPTPTPRTRTRTITREGVKGIAAPNFERNHDIPTLTGYKTDTKGYIKNFRSGYSRPTFDSYISDLKVFDIASIVSRDGQPLNLKYFRLAEKYFKKIPGTSQYNKPPTFAGLREPSRPTYGAVFYEKGSVKECIAIYGIHRGQGVCDFLALKSTTRYKTSLLKLILQKLANASSQREITFKLKSVAMRKAIKDIAVDYEGNGTTFKYKVVSLRSGVSTINEKPKRWMK